MPCCRAAHPDLTISSLSVKLKLINKNQGMSKNQNLLINCQEISDEKMMTHQLTKYKAKQKIFCLRVKAVAYICFAMHISFSKIWAFNFFGLLFLDYFFYSTVFINLPVKIYMKIYDRHNKMHWTTVYRLLELSDLFQSCILFIQKSCTIFHIGQRLWVVTDSNLTLLLGGDP